MRYLFLVVGMGIFVTSLQAYRDVGESILGQTGGLMAIAVFLIVQGLEVKPIIMTNGMNSCFQSLNRASAGKKVNVQMCDPEELADASGWALVGYGIDFVAGLLVWPLLSAWDLITIGGVTWSDVNFGNLVRIVMCVFLLQMCVQQFLKRGGKVPAFGRKGGSKDVKA